MNSQLLVHMDTVQTLRLTLLGLQRVKCLFSIFLLNCWYYIVAYSPNTTNHLSTCIWMMWGEIVDSGYCILHTLPVWEGKETVCTNSFSQECNKKKSI